MAYIGATEISLLLPAHVSIGTNTEPLTIGEVASMTVEISADLDISAAGAGYAVPISSTATVSWAAFQLAAKQGVGARILSILFPNLGGKGDKASSAAMYRDAYESFKQRLSDGTLILPDAGEIVTGGRALPRSFSTSFPNAAESGASPLVPITWQP